MAASQPVEISIARRFRRYRAGGNARDYARIRSKGLASRETRHRRGSVPRMRGEFVPQISLDLGFTDHAVDPISDDDSQCTPAWLADLLPVVDLDPCCNSSRIRAHRSVSLPNDGLASPWQKIARSVWCNPPYSNPLPWTIHGADAFDAGGVEQLWLVKLDPTTKWWTILAERGRVMLLRKRVQFEKNGVVRVGNNFCNALILMSSDVNVFGNFVARIEKDKIIW